MSTAQSADAIAYQQARRRLEKLAWLLDESFTFPGTNKRFGLDPLIGLIPGVGDVIGAGLSVYFIAEAARLGAPRSMQMRMLGNSVLEMAVGVIPVAGDLFDFYWKANSRNRQMLESYIDSQLQPPKTRASALTPVLLVLVFLLMIFLLIKLPVAGL